MYISILLFRIIAFLFVLTLDLSIFITTDNLRMHHPTVACLRIFQCVCVRASAHCTTRAHWHSNLSLGAWKTRDKPLVDVYTPHFKVTAAFLSQTRR